jgi:hypothetical protein
MIKSVATRIKNLSGFHFLDCRAAFFKEDAVTTVRAPDIHVNLNFLLAPCTFIGTCHIQSRLSFYLLQSPVDCALGYLHSRGLRLVRSTCKLIPAFPAFPDPGATALY